MSTKGPEPMEAEEVENGEKLGEKMSCLGDPNGQIYIYTHRIYTYSYMYEYTVHIWFTVNVFCFGKMCVFFVSVCFFFSCVFL